MYKYYDMNDYLRVADECSLRIKAILQTRYDGLEEWRDAVNDRYPFEDLYLKMAEVDDEERLISELLEYLTSRTEEMKRRIRREYGNVSESGE